MLRPFRPDDVDAVLRACQDPETQRWITALPVALHAARTRRGFVEDVAMRERADGQGLPAAVEADGEFVGTAGMPPAPGPAGPGDRLLDRALGPRARLRRPRPRAALADWALATARRGCTSTPTCGNAAVAGGRAAGGVHAGGRRARLPGVPGRAARRTRCCSAGCRATGRAVA